jgi:hypothetical protein
VARPRSTNKDDDGLQADRCRYVAVCLFLCESANRQISNSANRRIMGEIGDELESSEARCCKRCNRLPVSWDQISGWRWHHGFLVQSARNVRSWVISDLARRIWNKTFQAAGILKVEPDYFQEVRHMGRLRKGEKATREKRIQRTLRGYAFGLRESEIAEELDLHRRTVNNYLRELERQGRVYKDGRCWLADD